MITVDEKPEEMRCYMKKQPKIHRTFLKIGSVCCIRPGGGEMFLRQVEKFIGL